MGREPGKLQQIAALIASAGMIWYMLPDHHQQLIRMRAVHLAQRATARLAHGQGHTGMSEELAGRPADAARHYAAAAGLGRARDALGRVLEGMRP